MILREDLIGGRARVTVKVRALQTDRHTHARVHTERQTDRYDRTHYHTAFVGGNKDVKLFWVYT